MKFHSAVGCAAAGVSSLASAQTPSFVYFIQAPILLPGQTGTITVLCGFSPGVGGAVAGGTVLGLSSGAFNVTAANGAWSSNVGIAPYNFLPGVATFPGTMAGTNVNGIIWGNGFGPPIGTVSTVNPTPVWQATYTSAGLPIMINVIPVGAHGIWYMPPTGGIASELTSTAVTGASFIWFPAPAGLTLFGLAGLITARRQRRPACGRNLGERHTASP